MIYFCLWTFRYWKQFYSPPASIQDHKYYNHNNEKQNKSCQTSKQNAIETGSSAVELTLWSIVLLKVRTITSGQQKKDQEKINHQYKGENWLTYIGHDNDLHCRTYWHFGPFISFEHWPCLLQKLTFVWHGPTQIHCPFSITFVKFAKSIEHLTNDCKSEISTRRQKGTIQQFKLKTCQ